MNEYEEIELVRIALQAFCRDNPAWRSNWHMFTYVYDPVQRIIWWRRAKKQAEAGAPAMQQLLLKVVELRLKGQL